MIDTLRITILVDDDLSAVGLPSEHGLSFWIEADGRRILFDTGQSDLFARNARALGIDIADVETLVISHGHYDHTGGVATVLKRQPSPTVYCHPGVFSPRYSQKPDGSMKPVGMANAGSEALHRIVDSIRWTNAPLFLSEDIGITGPIPRTDPADDAGGTFYLDPDGIRPDPIDDDLSMWFRTSEGICVVTGCCHAGLVNTLRYIRTLLPGEHIHSVIGGFHLLHATTDRINQIGSFLESLSVRSVVPIHCSGEEAVRVLGDKCDAGGKRNHR